MDVGALKNKIQNNTIPDFLIFSGQEWEVQKVYIKQIAKVKEQDVVRVDSITDIYTSLRNKSFLTKSYCYVVRDDKELLTNEKLQEQISNGLLGDNTFILLLTNVDKRTKFYKQYKDSIIEFEPLTPAILKKYIKQKIDLSDKNIDRLIEVCEQDYGRILLEIDKIKRYGGEFDKAFEVLLKDGTIYKPPQDAIFDFVGAVLDRKVIAFDLLDQCQKVEEPALVMLSVLYQNAKAVLQVQSCKSGDTAKATGLTAWQIKNATNHKGKYTIGELVNMISLIQTIESGIKIGKIDEDVAIDYLLVNVL